MALPKWLQMVQQFAPMVLAFTPLAPIAPFVSAGIQEAEQIQGASGADKLAHAINIARQGIAATNAQAGRTVIDPNMADTAIAAGINTTVSVVNLVQAAHATDTPLVPTPPVVPVVTGSGGVTAAPPTTGQ
jgi:hypothetical protein